MQGKRVCLTSGKVGVRLVWPQEQRLARLEGEPVQQQGAEAAHVSRVLLAEPQHEVSRQQRVGGQAVTCR